MNKLEAQILWAKILREAGEAARLLESNLAEEIQDLATSLVRTTASTSDASIIVIDLVGTSPEEQPTRRVIRKMTEEVEAFLDDTGRPKSLKILKAVAA